MRSWVYMLPLIFPIAALYGLWMGGLATLLVVVLDFVLVPVIDMIHSGRGTEEDGLGGEHELGHDVVLFIGSILCWFGFGLLLVQLHAGVSGVLELVGLMTCGGILFGATGINIAHELGHRQSPIVSRFGQGLLLPSLYMHFTLSTIAVTIAGWPRHTIRPQLGVERFSTPSGSARSSEAGSAHGVSKRSVSRGVVSLRTFEGISCCTRR